jgi:2-amino-4-hydroxy-6-hydroxymethyldihydropteridine diphosphokinase
VARVYISIGSNIARERHIRAAVESLRERFGSLALSGIYESEPIGFEGENFYNLVAGFDTTETPEALIEDLHTIEQQLGRQRGLSRFASRTIDLDLLLYGNLVSTDSRLRLPRDEILEYACVLRPLAEIAPDERHPVTGISYRELWRRFPADSQPLTPADLPLSG